MKKDVEEYADFLEYNRFLAKQLVKIRKEIGWGQKEVAQAMGITLRAEQNYEYGRRRLTVALLGMFLETADVSADYFYGRTSNIHNHKDDKEMAEARGIQEDVSDIREKLKEYPQTIERLKDELQTAGTTLKTIQQDYERLEERYRNFEHNGHTVHHKVLP